MTNAVTWLSSKWGLLLLSCVFAALVLGVSGYYAWAAKKAPDPEIVSMPMSYQTKALAEPIVNTGVNADGLTLSQWTADKDVNGLTETQWKLRGGDPAKWVLATKGKPAVDYRPVPKLVWTLGETKGIFVLRHNCFFHKLADPMIDRVWISGDGKYGDDGATVLSLPSIPAPTRTDGCAVRNFFVDFHVAQVADVWRYKPSANFLKLQPAPPVRVGFKVITIELVAPATTPKVSVPVKP